MASDVRDADIIEFAGVHFMAETAKIVNPKKTVLLPNPLAGCQLADSAPAEDLVARINELKPQFPDLAVVSYVNTTAAVKALSDIIVTSANAAKVVRTLPNKNILFVPDRNLANHVAEQIREEHHSVDGYCYVHHRLPPRRSPGSARPIRTGDPGPSRMPADVAKLATPCSPLGDGALRERASANRFLIVTECGCRSPGDGSAGQDFLKGCNSARS